MTAGTQYRVAVVDPLPLFRQGVVAAVTSESLTVEVPTDIRSWVTAGHDRIVVITLSTAADWSLMTELAQTSPTLPIVALLESVTVSDSLGAIRAGASSVVGRDVTLEGIRRAIAAIVVGDALLPASILKTLASQAGITSQSDGPLSPKQLAWLNELASGRTVAHLATTAGYSERAMYRLLRAVYYKMGVTTRTEALMVAQENGWIKSVQIRRHPN